MPNGKLHILMTRLANILVKGQSCSALLRMLVVCASSCLKSVLRYKFLILVTYHLDSIFTLARM